MVLEVIKGQFVPDKAQQAVEWASKVMAYVKKAGLGTNQVSLLQPWTGNVSAFLFVGRYTSISELGDHVSKREADSGLTALLKERDESGWYLATTRTIYNEIESFG
jgi:hypothetical protein